LKKNFNFLFLNEGQQYMMTSY